jgi:nitrous oxide reductase accessory protein NosL
VAWLLGLLALGVAAVEAAEGDLAAHGACGYCGMDRKAYGYSRALVRYQDGAEIGVCSLHCAVVELSAHPERKVAALQVADRDTHALLDAEAATWVLGGRRRGVMTQRPKWAFATPAGAQAFVRAEGGAVVTWTEALAAAREDLAAEAAQAEARRRRASASGCGARVRPGPGPSAPRATGQESD